MVRSRTQGWHVVHPDGSGRFVLRRVDEDGTLRDVLCLVFGPDGDGLAAKGTVYLPGATPLVFDIVGPLQRPFRMSQP